MHDTCIIVGALPPHSAGYLDQFVFLNTGKTINQGAFLTGNVFLECFIGHMLRQVVKDDSFCHFQPPFFQVYLAKRIILRKNSEMQRVKRWLGHFWKVIADRLDKRIRAILVLLRKESRSEEQTS